MEVDLIAVVALLISLFSLGLTCFYILSARTAPLEKKRKKPISPQAKPTEKRAPKVIDDYKALQIEQREKERRTPLN